MENRDLPASFVRHWEALATAAGASPEVGGRLASFVDRLGVEVERAGIDVTEPSFASKTYEAPVMASPALRAMQAEIVAFSAENGKHPMLASAAIDAAVGPHHVGELFRPENAPSLDTTRQLVSTLERTMRIEGTAISPNDPELTRFVPVGAVADFKEIMTAIGLSETQQVAALDLGGRVHDAKTYLLDDDRTVAESMERPLDELREYALQGEPQQTAASYVLNLARLPETDFEGTAVRPGWALSAEETAKRIEDTRDQLRAEGKLSELTGHPTAQDIDTQARREASAEAADNNARAAGEIDLGPALEPMTWDTASMPDHPSAEVIDIEARRELAAELADDNDRRAEPGRDRSSAADEERTISPVFEREAEKAPETGERPQADTERAADAERPANGGREEPTAEPTNADPAKDKAAAFSVEKGDVPDSLRARYLIEADKLGGDVRFYTDAKSTTPAFKDSGAKLVTRETNSGIVSDMVATAVHRGWTEIKVTGEPEFKRQVWMEASLKGLEVTGFKPTERDKQELEKLLDARDGRSIEPARDRSQTQGGQDRQEGQNAARGDASEKSAAPQRPDFDKGVSGVLVETGSAPYKHDAKNEASAYVVVETSPGQKTEIWGVGLPDALKRGGAEIGDTVNVRRDGTEIVQKTVQTKDERTGETRPEVKDVPRNRWEVTAERFREASPAEAARDPATREAQSTLKVIETALAERVPDKGLRDKLMSVAKEHIASKLASGGTFKEARVRETMRKDPTPRNQRAVSKTTQRTDDKKRSQDARTNKAVATKAVKAAEKQDDKGKVRKNPERSRSR